VRKEKKYEEIGKIQISGFRATPLERPSFADYFFLLCCHVVAGTHWKSRAVIGRKK
jgi:hypothetical protein